MLKHITTLPIAHQVREHRFLRGLRKQLSRIQPDEIPVFGTANRRTPELYGWHGSVASHVDNKGLVYLLILDSPIIQISCGDTSISASEGMLLCLDDRTLHQTVQPANSNSIALFIGAFDERCDDFAVEQLSLALDQLSTGEYIEALRPVRVPLCRDECYAIPGEEDSIDITPTQICRLSNALRDNKHVIRCAHPDCDEPAAVIDSHYPYYQDLNRCRKHAGKR